MFAENLIPYLNEKYGGWIQTYLGGEALLNNKDTK